jgi:hypothetical protein
MKPFNPKLQINTLILYKLTKYGRYFSLTKFGAPLGLFGGSPSISITNLVKFRKLIKDKRITDVIMCDSRCINCFDTITVIQKRERGVAHANSKILLKDLYKSLDLVVSAYVEEIALHLYSADNFDDHILDQAETMKAIPKGVRNVFRKNLMSGLTLKEALDTTSITCGYHRAGFEEQIYNYCAYWFDLTTAQKHSAGELRFVIDKKQLVAFFSCMEVFKESPQRSPYIHCETGGGVSAFYLAALLMRETGASASSVFEFMTAAKYPMNQLKQPGVEAYLDNLLSKLDAPE